MRRRDCGRGLLATTSLAALLLGCGVNSQSHPVPLPLQPTPVLASARSDQNGYTVTVYFVQFGRLAPVTRPAPDRSPQTALRLLADGPETVEATMGLETALVPQQLTTVPNGRGPLTVEAGREFTSIVGDNQLLAAAQLVWTATSDTPDRLVRIRVEGKPLEVPTDDGLSRLPVGRADYATVAPVETSRTSSPDSPTPTKPTPDSPASSSPTPTATPS